MKLVLVLSLALFAAVASAADAECHPACRWQCDDPVCPAICHPICERPRCQMQCEETQCAKCTVHCEKPVCSVRCPKDMCEKESCPKCETVCAPAQCTTKCAAPPPSCSPVCEETKCDWKCRKPTLCPKPKCELKCEKPMCDANANQCCKCNSENNVKAAMDRANSQFIETDSDSAPERMSFLEAFSTLLHKSQTTAEAQCCPCADWEN